GPVIDAARDDDQLTFLDDDASIAELHREPSPVDEKEFVLVLVAMPDEHALELDHLHVMAVHVADDFGGPMRREERELLPQVDLVHAPSVGRPFYPAPPP